MSDTSSEPTGRQQGQQDDTRKPGRPRKGLVKVLMSLRPEQLASLRIIAVQMAAGSTARADVSAIVRDFLDHVVGVEALASRALAQMRESVAFEHRRFREGVGDPRAALEKVKNVVSVTELAFRDIMPEVAEEAQAARLRAYHRGNTNENRVDPPELLGEPAELPSRAAEKPAAKPSGAKSSRRKSSRRKS
jgi:hypothetical protein